MNTLRLIWAGMVEIWCQTTHGGGHIERDPSGRVNWQCNRCGRWAQPVPEGDEANLLKQHMKWLLEKPDCAGGSPCSTCPDKRKCDHGCIRIPDFISTEFHRREWSALQRIRAAIAADRCDGSTEYAAGVNAACAQHLLLIDTYAQRYEPT